MTQGVTRSTRSFPDGSPLRVEIPSVEHPEVFEAVLRAADDLGVTVNRVSQGSGAMLLTESELDRMAQLGNVAGVEVCLFVGPRAGWDTGAVAHAADGAASFGSIRGNDQLALAVHDVVRAVEHGIRSFLIADLGLLRVLRSMQLDGRLPADVGWKISAYLPNSNPPMLELLAELGATSVNVPSDLSVPQLAELRSVVELPLDLYVEAPDSMGGTIRVMELGPMVRAAAPLHAKFGLANMPSVYPAGLQNRTQAAAAASEKVRRAAISLEWMHRLDPGITQSPPGAPGTLVPQV